jgi:hypothetical protein
MKNRIDMLIHVVLKNTPFISLRKRIRQFGEKPFESNNFPFRLLFEYANLLGFFSNWENELFDCPFHLPGNRSLCIRVISDQYGEFLNTGNICDRNNLHRPAPLIYSMVRSSTLINLIYHLYFCLYLYIIQ